MTEWCTTGSMAAAVAMVSNGFSIADPEDGGMLEVVGFDAAAPQLIADFAAALLQRESLRDNKRCQHKRGV